MRAKLTTFELARVLVGRFIVNANHSIMSTAAKLRDVPALVAQLAAINARSAAVLLKKRARVS